jgi:diaminohydroxyphosphoribosylaminopyrimidine deaminase/5-amino-6-(5-phosphoribosylamino)uracil reductase
MTEDEAMRRAIALAARGLGTTSPNPVVGCLLLDPAGEVVGEGFHAYAGGPHAEIVALAQAGERARGGTAVVTLEPCNHTGRTGPCADALITAGVRRVVIAVDDPTPVAAGGAATLRGAGVEVETGVRRREAEQGNIAWLTAVRRGRPYVTWKFAATLDGRSAAADGTSRWITSPPARADVHALRGTMDAIMAGAGTVLTDDPQLTVRDLRDGTLAIKQPLRVVVDSHGRTPEAARVRDAAAPTWIATTGEVGAGPDGRVDLPALLAALFGRGIRSILLEGGPTLAGAFLGLGLVDRVIGYVAPKLLGAGTTALVGAGVTTIGEAIELDLTDLTQIGPDLRFTASPRPKPPELPEPPASPERKV